MNYFTTDLYELKREILNFSKKVSSGLDKPKTKFLSDMLYGIFKSKSCLISEISRELDEKVKLKNTIERLCDNLNNLSEEEFKIIDDNYIKVVKKKFPKENPIALFDDSDIAKRYGKKFEDLDQVIDASSQNKEVVSGYHVCESVILTEKEKQPISVYSNIYSCQSDGFKSKNDYTIKNIDKVIEVIGSKEKDKNNNEKIDMVFDRGYDCNQIIKNVDDSDNYFVIRMQDRRNFLFKGKKKNCHEIAIKRKGKIKMNVWFEYEEKECYVSHTKVTMPFNNKDYELVIVYGLSEEHPMILLTNRAIHSKEDVIKIVRLYFSRWRIEEYFRIKKQEYDFENMRVRTLKSINNLNLLLKLVMGLLSMLVEEIDRKLLTIKIIERSKSLRKKVILYLSQIARGIGKILSFARCGIKEFQEIETRSKYKQLELRL